MVKIYNESTPDSHDHIHSFNIHDVLLGVPRDSTVGTTAKCIFYLLVRSLVTRVVTRENFERREPRYISCNMEKFEGREPRHICDMREIC